MFRSFLRLPVALIAVLGVLVVAACSAPTTDGTTATDVATGPRTAVVDSEPEPITTDPAPVLPATVRGVDGVETTITDISRIVVADRSGTLAQTVYSLGLGDKLVGRSTASFPAIEDVPNVTPGGHGLNAEAILALNPTVVLTDTSIGPLAVQEQVRATGVPVVFVDPERSLDTVADDIERSRSRSASPRPVRRSRSGRSTRSPRQRTRSPPIIPNPPSLSSICAVRRSRCSEAPARAMRSSQLPVVATPASSPAWTHSSCRSPARR